MSKSDELPKLKCGDCRTCCIGSNVVLRPDLGDVLKKYKRVKIDGQWVLAKGASGECAYLGPTGCKVYHDQPYACRNMDCRAYELMVRDLPTIEQAWRREHSQIGPILAEGARRLAAA